MPEQPCAVHFTISTSKGHSLVERTVALAWPGPAFESWGALSRSPCFWACQVPSLQWRGPYPRSWPGAGQGCAVPERASLLLQWPHWMQPQRQHHATERSCLPWEFVFKKRGYLLQLLLVIFVSQVLTFLIVFENASELQHNKNILLK